MLKRLFPPKVEASPNYVNANHPYPMTPAEFDAAAAAWRSNKIRQGESWAYRCSATTSAGTQCSRPAKPWTPTLYDDPLHCVLHSRYPPPPRQDEATLPAAVTAHVSAAPDTSTPAPVVSDTSTATQTAGRPVRQRTRQPKTVAPTPAPA